MKVSAFYATFFRRQNLLKEFFVGLFLGLCSWPRLILEVFLRRQMGERYFSLTSVLVIFAVLCRLPSLVRHRSYDEPVIGPFAFWYVFALAFLAMGLYHKWENRRLPQRFNFKRFSLSTGKSWPQLLRITYQGETKLVFPPMLVDTVVEPAVAFLPGALLWWGLHQYVGVLLMGCAVIYSLSYVAAYQQGTDFLLDQIDQQICQQDLGATMVKGIAPNFSRGVHFPGELPADPEERRQVASAFLDEEVAYPVRWKTS